MSTETANLQDLTLSELAYQIQRDWTSQTKKDGTRLKVNYAAVPYLDSMKSLDSVGDKYGLDSGKDMVLYFLSNATTYKGENARLFKAELKRRIGIK